MDNSSTSRARRERIATQYLYKWDKPGARTLNRCEQCLRAARQSQVPDAEVLRAAPSLVPCSALRQNMVFGIPVYRSQSPRRAAWHLVNPKFRGPGDKEVPFHVSFPLSMMAPVWLSYGCHNKLPQTGWFETIDIYSFTCLEGQISKIKVLAGSHSLQRLWNGILPCPFQFLVVPGVPWLVAA